MAQTAAQKAALQAKLAKGTETKAKIATTAPAIKTTTPTKTTTKTTTTPTVPASTPTTTAGTTYVRDDTGNWVKKEAGVQAHSQTGEAIKETGTAGKYEYGTGVIGETPKTTTGQTTADIGKTYDGQGNLVYDPDAKKDTGQTTMPETGLEELQKTFQDLGSEFSRFRDMFASNLGELGKTALDTISKLEQETGGIVNTSDQNLQRELQNLTPGQDASEILKKYILPANFKLPAGVESIKELGQKIAPDATPEEQRAKAEKYLNQMLIQNAVTDKIVPNQYRAEYVDYNKAIAGEPEVKPTVTPTEQPGAYEDESFYEEYKIENQISNILDDEFTGLNSGNALDMIMQYGGNISSMDAIDLIVQSKLGDIYKDTTGEYLNMMQAGLDQQFQQSLLQGVLTVDEINSAISGEEFTPTTFKGLQVKIWGQEKEYQQEAIDVEKEYQQEQFNATMAVEREKRGRLEGFLKAQLVSMGALDSSAGLTAMATQVNQADMRLHLMEAENARSMALLNLESRKIQSTFTNNIAGLVMQAEADQAQAAQDYQDKSMEILGMRIENEKEKNQLKAQALDEWYTRKVEIEDKLLQQKNWEYEQSYKATQDTIENAFKLSNQTGTSYFIDENGEIVDSGLPTLEGQKYVLDVQKENRAMDTDLKNQAMDLLDRYGTVAAGVVEQAFGMTEGTLSQFKTIDEQTLAFDYWCKNLENSQKLREYNDGLSSINAFREQLGLDSISTGQSNIANLYADGTDGDECGTFAHNFVIDYPYGLDTWQQKAGVCNITTAELRSGNVQVGDLIMTKEYGKNGNLLEAGHVQVVNTVNGDGTVTLTDSNYDAYHTVSNDRVFDLGKEKVLGAFRGTLNPAIQITQQQTDISDISLDTPLDQLGDKVGVLSGALTGIVDLIPEEEKSKYTIEDVFDMKGFIDLQKLQQSFGQLDISDKMITQFERFNEGDNAYYNNLSSAERKLFLDTYYKWEEAENKPRRTDKEEKDDWEA